MSKRVLVLADEPLLAEFVRRPLEPLGHEVVEAGSGDDALRLARATPFDVVLIARRPPSGSELATVVDQLRSALDPRPTLVVVGVSPRDRELSRKVGADAFLLVPFLDADLLDLLGTERDAQKTVLLVDDSPLIHRHTVPILLDEGYAVLQARDGEEGLASVRGHAVDLVITDVEMPKMNGYELCRAIKHDPSTSHVPVLICSTLGEAADLERGFDAGADDYIVKPVVPEELSTRAHVLIAGKLPASRERILVVDDSPAQRHFVADCLARQGFDVVTAADGRAALEKARVVRPALVVSDYEMPVMTGFELVHALRRDPDLKGVPVIMLTARDSKRDMAQLRAAGASAYLVKPFAQDKCVAIVERTLAEKRLLAYKEASRLYISDAARRAAEERAASGALSEVRADERELAVLFSDLAGFTPMSEKLSPRALIELLNAYFDAMCPIIKDHGGDIDKFIGDAILAVFDEERGALPPSFRAVQAGLAMQAAMAGFNAGRSVELAMRIGINTGPLIRGDLGSRVVRRDYTVIGDTVNRANRYESKCPVGGVMISQSTRDALGESAVVRPVPGLSLKGVSEPVVAYVVESITAPASAEETS